MKQKSAEKGKNLAGGYLQGEVWLRGGDLNLLTSGL